jgi:hypothetical protein
MAGERPGTVLVQGRHRVRARLGKRIEYKKEANESTSEPAHNIRAGDELFVARGFT